jgi:hypothetical protein
MHSDNLYSPPKITAVIRPRRMSWTGGTDDTRKIQRILEENTCM